MPQVLPRSCATALLALPLLAAAAGATPITLAFDAGDPIGGLSIGAILSTQYAALIAATFGAPGFSGAGRPSGNWGTNPTMAIVASSGVDVGTLGTPAWASGNLLRSFSGWLSENGAPSFFIPPVDSFSVDFAAISTPGSSRVFADNGPTLLTTVSTPLTGQQSVGVSGVGTITSVVVTPGDFFDWVGVDNIRFNTVTAVAAPSTFALLGRGLAAACLRRRR